MTGLTPEYEVMGIREPSNSHFSTTYRTLLKYTPYILARSCLSHSQESEKYCGLALRYLFSNDDAFPVMKNLEFPIWVLKSILDKESVKTDLVVVRSVID